MVAYSITSVAEAPHATQRIMVTLFFSSFPSINAP